MRTILRYTIVLAFFFWIEGLQSQEQPAIFFLHNIPATAYSNPARVPNSEFYLDLPVIPKIHVNGDFGQVTFQKLFKHDPNRGDSLVFDPTEFANSLSKDGQIRGLVNLDLLGAGFRVGAGFISLGVGLHAYADVPYSKDLLLFMAKGNDSFLGETMHLLRKDHKIDITSYLSASVGYSMEVLPQLTVGARGKLLFGIANVGIENSEVTIHTDENDYTLTISGNILGRTSSVVPLQLPGFGEDTSSRSENPSFADIFKNIGFGFDIGAVYDLNETMKVSLSVTDIGMIHWAAGSKEFRSHKGNSAFYFSGLDVDLSNTDDLGSMVESLADSLQEHFDIRKTDITGYSTVLPAKINASFEWECVPLLSLGGLYSLEFTPSGRLFHALSIFPVLSIEPWLDIALGNTFASTGLLNPSCALNLRGGGFSFYTAMSLSNSIYVKNMNRFSVSVGMCLMF